MIKTQTQSYKKPEGNNKAKTQKVFSLESKNYKGAKAN